MKHTVLWLPTAQTQLAGLWLYSQDRQALSESAARLDRALSEGSSITPCGSFAACFDSPLSVLCAVNSADKVVKIVQVRQSGS